MRVQGKSSQADELDWRWRDRFFWGARPRAGEVKGGSDKGLDVSDGATWAL